MVLNDKLALWSRAYPHKVFDGVTTGLGGVKRRFAGAQRSSSHIVIASNIDFKTSRVKVLRSSEILCVTISCKPTTSNYN